MRHINLRFTYLLSYLLTQSVTIISVIIIIIIISSSSSIFSISGENNISIILHKLGNIIKIGL